MWLLPQLTATHTHKARGTAGSSPGWDGAQAGQGYYGAPSPSRLSIPLSPTHGPALSPARCCRRFQKGISQAILPSQGTPDPSPVTPGHCLHTRAPSPSTGHPKSPQGSLPFYGGAGPFHPRAPLGLPLSSWGDPVPTSLPHDGPHPQKGSHTFRETSMPEGTPVPPFSREPPRLILQPRQVPLVLLPLFQGTLERYPGGDPVPQRGSYRSLTHVPQQSVPHPCSPSRSAWGQLPPPSIPPLSPTLSILERFTQSHPFLLMASQKGSPG